MPFQPLHHFSPSDEITPTLLLSFYPLWQINSYFILPPLNNPLTLTPFYPLASSTFNSYYPLWSNYPPNLYIILPSWQPCPYLNLTPLNKNPLTHSILPPWQLIFWFILPPSEWITPSVLDHFIRFGSSTLTSFYPLWTNYPPTHRTLHPLGCPSLTSFYPLWTNYPLTLTPFYPLWQLNSYIILPPLNKLPPHCYIILPPLAAQQGFVPQKFSQCSPVQPAFTWQF